jgi:signal transduction histidine kinase
MIPRSDERASTREADDSEHELSRSRREVNEELVLSALRALDETDAAEVRETNALRLAEVRERLMAILGHDLRNPLGAMMMGLGVLIAHGKLSEEDAHVVERILKSGNRMNRMISQILQFTRARLGGGLLIEQRTADLGELCRTVVQELELATSAHVHCTVDGDITGCWDADRLAEVLSNIAGNAIEHARAGTSVALHAYGTGDDVIVEISNEGRAIPPDVLPFIFEPFRRATQHEHSKAGNLGLGLFIAREVVHAHGGSLSAHSDGGRTTFSMRLPRYPSPPS